MGRTRLILFAVLLALGIGLLASVLQLGQPHTVDDWAAGAGREWLLPAPTSEASARVVLFLALAFLVVVHLTSLRSCVRLSPTRTVLVVILAAAAGLSLLATANKTALSGDIYSYIIYGRMIAEHGLNPMVTSPEAVSDDPFFGLVGSNYRDTVSVYGPYWNFGSAGATSIAEGFGGTVGAYLWVYRLMTLAAMLVGAGAIWMLLATLAPSYQVPGTILYAWNPLVLFETAAPHNDIVMMSLVLVGILLVVRQRPYWGLTALLVASLVKWIAVVALLIVMTAWLSSLPAAGRLAALAKSALVSLAVLAPLLILGDPVGSLLSPFSDAGSGIHNTLSEFLVAVLSRATGMEIAELIPMVELASRAAVAATVVAALVLAWRRPTIRWAVTLSAMALLLVLLLAPRFWPWYAVWPLALAPLSMLPVRWAALSLSYSAPLNYVLYPVPGDPAPWGTARSLVVFGVPVLVFLVGLWWTKFRPSLPRRGCAPPADENGRADCPVNPPKPAQAGSIL